MKKIHTRTKRKMDLSSSHRHKAALRGIKRKKRAKTFAEEKAAKEWMKKQNLSEKDYRIEKAKKGKRLIVKKII